MYVVFDKRTDSLHVVYESVREANFDGIYPLDRHCWQDARLGDWVLCDDGCVTQLLDISNSYYYMPSQKIRKTQRVVFGIKGYEAKMPKDKIGVEEALYLSEFDDPSRLSAHFRDIFLRAVEKGAQNPDAKGFPLCLAIAGRIADMDKFMPMGTALPKKATDGKDVVALTNDLYDRD